MTKFHLKAETESSLRNIVSSNKNRMMDNAQKNNNLIRRKLYFACYSDEICTG
jgi:hypothetical protein